ncbi:MAG: hypothetical protein AAF670_20270 [Planctomycetota bacterium]
MKNLLLVGLVALVATQCSAADEKANKKNAGKRNYTPGANVTKHLSSVSLTDEQKTQLDEAQQKLAATLKELRGEGFTRELTKKRAEAAKAAREAGVKQKDMAAKLSETLSADELTLLDKAAAAQAAFKKAIVGMMTPEQIESLSDEAKKVLLPRQGSGNAKGKKKKAA